MKKLLFLIALMCAPAFGADVPISGLPSAGSVSTGDLVACVQSGNTKKCTVNQVIAAVEAAMAPVATSGAASDLTGTLPSARLPALTGDVTTSAGSAATTIAASAVTLAKQAPFAANSLQGNNTGSPATPVPLNAAQAKILLGIAAGDVSGLAAVATSGSASDLSTGTVAAARGGAGAVNGALKGNGSGVVSQAACADLSNAAASCSTDATNAANISSGTINAARSWADTGDVTRPAGSAATTIAAGAVTLAKQANLAANSLQGNNTGSAATPIAMTAAQAKILLGIAASDVSGLAAIATSGSVSDLAPIANGTLLGNGGASPAAPSVQTAIPSGITADSSLITSGILAQALLPAPNTRYASTTSLTLSSTDNGNAVAQSNAAAVAATLPQIGTSSIAAGFQVLLLNQGAGTITVTPTTSTINGASTLTVPQGQDCLIVADNATSPGNYNTLCGMPTQLLASSLVGGTNTNSTAYIFTNASWASVGWAVLGTACGNTNTARSNNPGGSGSPTFGICTNGSQAVTWDGQGIQQPINPPVDVGSSPTITTASGTCVVGSKHGGPIQGSFAVTSGSGTCTFTISGLPGTHNAGSGAVSNTGYAGRMSDLTQTSGLLQTGALSATSISFTGTGIVTSDVLTYGPLGAF